jgi:hypothetical protein
MPSAKADAGCGRWRGHGGADRLAACWRTGGGPPPPAPGQPGTGKRFARTTAPGRGESGRPGRGGRSARSAGSCASSACGSGWPGSTTATSSPERLSPCNPRGGCQLAPRSW